MLMGACRLGRVLWLHTAVNYILECGSTAKVMRVGDADEGRSVLFVARQ